MSVVWSPTPATAASAPVRGLLDAWRSLSWREAGWFLLVGGLMGGMNLVALADPALRTTELRVLIAETIGPVACSMILLLAWLPADRSASDSPRRLQRLAAAVLLATLLSALLVPLLLRLLELPTAMELAHLHKGKAAPGGVAMFLADSLAALIPSGLAVAVLEMAGRHRRSERAVSNALDEHARLARATLESRLAAMQAQVEPGLLFDVLVDIERLYGADPTGTGVARADRDAAVTQMERLITYLRVALPKLRETGSTIAAEVDLLSCYLDLVQGMHGGQPTFVARVPPELAGMTFHPMLLLPLVQHALRSDSTLPKQIELEIRAQRELLCLELTIAAPALCQDDDELQRLRERLQVLYAGHANLHCEDLPVQSLTTATPAEPTSDAPLRITRFTLELPR